MDITIKIQLDASERLERMVRDLIATAANYGGAVPVVKVRRPIEEAAPGGAEIVENYRLQKPKKDKKEQQAEQPQPITPPASEAPAEAPVDEAPCPYPTDAELKAHLARIRDKFEGAGWKENPERENVQKYHNQLSDLFKWSASTIALRAGCNNVTKPTQLPMSVARLEFVDEIDSYAIMPDGKIGIPSKF